LNTANLSLSAVRAVAPEAKPGRRIFVADQIAHEGVEFLRSQAGLEVDFTTGLDVAGVIERVRDCEALIVRSATRVTAEIIAAAPRLRVIGRAGIGVDNIDVEAATERGIVVLNTPDANATTTAELAVAHIMSLSRHLPAADASTRAGKWERSKYMGTELTGKTVGIIGYGTIGRIVASRCLGLKMHVVTYDPYVTREVVEDDGVECMGLDELLETADYVTLHCPLNDSTRNLIDAQRFARMKAGARLVNCARGGIVDEAALHEALRTGRLAGAALDVFEQEPPAGSPLLALPNVVMSPHLGASTTEAQVATGVEIARQVAAFLQSGEAVNAVNLPSVSAEEMRRLRPYQELAVRLGRLLAMMLPGPIGKVEVSLLGRAAELDAHAIAVEALVGLLNERLSVPVNPVNACHNARRQGISLTESRSEQSHGYLTLVRVIGHGDDSRSVTLEGTLFDEQHLRLVRVNDYELEAFLEGNLLLTLHEDRPGVVGALGALLGNANVNISRMQLGLAPAVCRALAVLEISERLSEALLAQIAAIPAICEVHQITM
jgi:D-3-phosphoglycerate dehydrogenase